MAFARAIETLDLSTIINTVQEELGLKAEDAARAEELYRQFLILCHKYPEQKVVPPKLADHIWHEHITHTRKYAEDCDNLFGAFIHHNPSQDNLESAFSETKELYKKEFSVDLENYGMAPELMSASACSG